MSYGKAGTGDYQVKANNLMGAASPMKNFDFDFGLGGPLAKKAGGSLKDQKLQNSQPQSRPSPARPAGGAAAGDQQPSAPWSTTPQAHSQQQQQHRSSTPPPSYGSAYHSPSLSQQQQRPGGQAATSPSWLPTSSSSSSASNAPQGGGGLGGKGDAFASLWSDARVHSAASSPAPAPAMTRHSSAPSMASPDEWGAFDAAPAPAPTPAPGPPPAAKQQQQQQSRRGGAPAATPRSPPLGSTPASAAARGSSDPFSGLLGSAKLSLAAMKTVPKPASSPAPPPVSAPPPQQQQQQDPFDLNGMWGSLGPGTQTARTAAPPPASAVFSSGGVGAAAPAASRGSSQAAADPFASTSAGDPFAFLSPNAPQQAASSGDPFGDFGGGFDGFQSAGPTPVADEDEEFDDFESAPPGGSAPRAQEAFGAFSAPPSAHAGGGGGGGAGAAYTAYSDAGMTHTMRTEEADAVGGGGGGGGGFDDDPFDDGFADFQGGGSNPPPASAGGDLFGGGLGFESTASHSSAADADPFGAFFGGPAGSTAGAATSSDPFDAIFGTGGGAATRPVAVDPLEALLLKTDKAPPPGTAAAGSFHGGAVGRGGGGGEGGDVGWGNDAMGLEGEGGATTDELEGLPPAPPGLNAHSAAEKGTEYYRGGQFADAIKWLIWAEQLCATSGGEGKLREVLRVRASCYKEAGELKKAVADYSQVLELNPADTGMLMQRAILYESMEKYKLGAKDARRITQIDPSNRPAMTLLSRLQKALANS